MCMHDCMHVFVMYCISRLPASVPCREAAAVSAGVSRTTGFKLSEGGDSEYLMAGNADCVISHQARLAQSAERKTLNLVVVGSSPTLGASG